MSDAKTILTDVVESFCTDPVVEEYIDAKKTKGEERWERDDVIWLELLLSMATLQGSQGDQLLMDEEKRVVNQKYGRVAFETIEMVQPEYRHEYLENALLDGNVSMHRKKAEALVANFGIINEKWGDPIGAKQGFEAEDGPEAKMAFLKQFEQIGPKYARNIGMDLYHPDFHEFIALDSRIKNISTALGLPYREWDYDKHEGFYESVADQLGIQPWELDRILYRYEDQILAELK